MLKNTFGLILPAVRPIQPYLDDDSVSEIMINGDQRVFIERGGRIQEITADIDFTRFNLRFASTTIARLYGRSDCDAVALSRAFFRIQRSCPARSNDSLIDGRC